MKLGTETGSFINHMHARGVIGQPRPEVGMGATILLWTDRHAATIVEVFRISKNGCYVTTQDDKSIVTAGSAHDGSAEYSYAPNLKGARRTFRTGRNGLWEAVRKNEATGRWVKARSWGLRIGEREEYRDPSF